MRIKANGLTFNVLECGARGSIANRPVLVFLHYFGGSSRTWTEVISRLSADYHCLAPDLRGFGESDAPTSGYAVKDYADDVAGLVAAAKVKNYVLVGHSMGGKIALAFAARRPVGLRSLVLLAPSPPTPEPISEEERARLLNTHGDRAAAIETIGKITAHPVPISLQNLLVEDNLRSSRRAWRAWLETGSREDLSADMKLIDVPVIVAAGGKDESLTARVLQREVVRRIGGARLTTLPDVAHLLPLENSSAIAGLVRRHCESIEDTQSIIRV